MIIISLWGFETARHKQFTVYFSVKPVIVTSTILRPNLLIKISQFYVEIITYSLKNSFGA